MLQAQLQATKEISNNYLSFMSSNLLNPITYPVFKYEYLYKSTGAEQIQSLRDKAATMGIILS